MERQLIEGGVNMDQSLRNKDQLDMLVKVVIELENRVLQLESDIYDMKREQVESKRSSEQLRFRLDIMEPKDKTIHF